MIVYTDRCLRCSERKKWKLLRQLAAARGEALVERRVSIKKAWLEEVRIYGVEMPFIVNGPQVISFNEPLERIE